MAVEVIMPQMGESIFEGTITKWLKKPGDSIERDEPLFEISTDKVDAEIPSPAAGVLKEIRVEEGKTVPIQTVVAVIDSAGSQSAAKSVAARPAEAPAAPAASAKAQAPTAQPPSATRPQSPQRPEPQPEARAERRVAPPLQQKPMPDVAASQEASAPEDEEEESVSPDGKRIRSSPLVRRLARENQIDLATIQGSGVGGRISKKDVLAAISAAERPAAPAPQAAPPPSAPPSIPGPPRLALTAAGDGRATRAHLFRPLRSSADERDAPAHCRAYGSFQTRFAPRLLHR